MSAVARALPAGPGAVPTLAPMLQHVLCVLIVASAIKAPLHLPLYWNAGLLVLGLFGLICVQSLQRIFLWMVLLIGLGAAFAITHDLGVGTLARLVQLFLLVMATSVIVRIEPDLLLRYLVLLIPAIVLIWLAETFWPEPTFHERTVLGEAIPRQGGLHGEPNYGAMLYGVVGVLLARRPPRALAILPFLFAVPTLSRGVWIAALAWIGVLAGGRHKVKIALPLILLLALQPFLVLGLDLMIDDETRERLVRLSTDRLAIWLGYLQMGLSDPLGVGYFRGTALVQVFQEDLPRAWFAHSLYMQVFGEFGWLGYLAFLGFVLHVTLRVARLAPAELPVLVFLFTGYALVNGLSDWAFWLTLGYVLARARQGEAVRP
ncbi:MAG TPA: O-antigen ligase family protein [Geminicoccaceae bacterium]